MRIHAVPQFQGALVESRARLPSGCRALAGLAGRVLGAEVTEVPVGTGTSPTVGGIANHEVLLAHQDAQRTALSEVDEPVLTIGGDCSVDLVPVRRLGDDVTVLWFDAHADLNTPESSPSGAFHGMVLRSAMGEREVVLVGTRSIDDGERPLIGEGKRVALVECGDLAPRNRQVYLHIDLDVLSPNEFSGMTYPEPDGVAIDALVRQVRQLSPEWTVVGAAITECVTADEAELAKLIPLLEAVGEVLTYGDR
ncbi:arginase family protein [Allokutzneria sp. A3M-2-11 16]|uniref:arginase family protein n=1 Tax=Allokutzneria sp. A3M-2-11 16 TaxID=2962043 RepID=UPI0020B84917|nr:arginase family protein [Allokutzneria sp. A3M-2-11 16]MCP3798041.1 arginase family protein [Allokutzneria sp. A3M-2-11 16]